MNPTPKSMPRTTIENVAVLLGTWLVAFVLVQAGRQIADHWFVTPLAALAAAAAGILVAVRRRAAVALFLILGAAAWIASTLGAHVVWGIRSVQGGATHLTIGAAAMLGVVFGALGVVARRRRDPGGDRHPAL